MKELRETLRIKMTKKGEGLFQKERLDPRFREDDRRERNVEFKRIITGFFKSRKKSLNNKISLILKPSITPSVIPAKARIQFVCFLFLLLTAACGFTPIYGPHEGTDISVRNSMNNVFIDNIADRHGQILRNQLIDRLYSNGRPTNPTSRLTITLASTELDLGIQKDATASRSELSLWATYALKNLSGKEIFKSKAHSVVSYSKLEAQYGTVTAQRNAYERAIKEVGEQIVNRLALYFAESARRTPTPDYPSFLLPQAASHK